MAYENLELIQVFNGANSTFTPANYKDKLVLVTGSPDAATNADKDPYIYAIDGAGQYRSFRLPHSFVRGIKATVPDNVQNESGYVDGLIEFVGANGVIVSRTGGKIIIDASSLNTTVNEHTAQITTVTGVANQAKTDSASALTKIRTLVGTTAGDEALSAREIAEDVAAELKEEILGTSGDGDSIGNLREDVDAVTEAVETLNGNSSVEGSVDKKIQDAINAFAGTADADNVIENITELLNYVAGVDGSKDLASALAQIEENKGKIETLNGSATTAGSVDKKVKDAIDAEVSRANAAYATKAQGEKADSAIQDVFSGNGTIASNYIKVTDDQNDAKKKGIDANIKRMSEVTGVGQELDGLVSALDIYAYMKARFSVKVVS